MKKHSFKKDLALGALIACSLAGPIYAEDIVNVPEGGSQNTPPTIYVGTGDAFRNAGTVTANDSITIDEGYFENNGIIKTGTLDIFGSSNSYGPNETGAFISGEITATNEIIYRGIQGHLFTQRLNNTILHTPKLTIEGGATQTGLLVTNPSTLNDVGAITVISNGKKTGLVIGGEESIEIHAPVYLHNNGTSEDARIEVTEGGSLTIDNIISEAGKTMFQLDEKDGKTSSALIKNITVQEGGNFSLQTNGDAEQTNTFELNTITVEDNAQFKTSVYDGSCSNAKIIGDDVTINLRQNAKADFGGVGAGTEAQNNWRGDMINFQVDKLTINLNSTDEYQYDSIEKDYKHDYAHGVYIHKNGKYDPEKGLGQIKVVGAGTANTGDLENDLQRLAYVVKITQEREGQEATALPDILAPVGATVEQKPGGIDDGGTGTVVDENGNVGNIKPIKNPDVYGAAEIGALGLLSWRTELDDMNRRLGELRDSAGEHGLWVRMIRGENDYRSLDSQHNIYQIGYDRKLSSDPHWTLGAAFSYTDGEGSYDTGRFDMSHKTLTLYGSRLNDDGSYIDIVGKYSRLNHDLENTWGSGDYDADGYSLGVEVGKRFTQESGFWIEPQAQLIYGYVGSASYDAGDIHIAQDSMQSLIGRAGVRLGKDFDKGNVYLRASYLYDFDGDTGVTFTDAQGRSRDFDQDLGGGWCEVGLGTNINLSDTTHLYFDIEKTFGAEIATTWQWNAGMRWSF